MKYEDLENGWVTVKFITGQETVGYLESINDNRSYTFKNLCHILPDPNDQTGKSMLLSPFMQFAERGAEETYSDELVMNMMKPAQGITDMMVQKFSSIIQSSSTVSKLIL